MKKFFTLLTIFFLLGVGIYLFAKFQLGPYGKGGVVYISGGSSLNQIAAQLEEAGIVRHGLAFKLLARWEGAERSLMPGEYGFDAGMTPRAVLGKIHKGERIIRQFTIPEGATFTQIAQQLEQAGIASYSEVLTAFRAPPYLKKFDFPAESLEGYLFPATYEYNRETTLEQILNQMIQTFKQQYDGELLQRTRQGAWTISQVVTLASIIEKETGRPAERPLISSVFHNRLRLGMPLQSDPTVIYGLQDFDGNLRKADLTNPHAYNTYVHAGLPPGPIASPGKESLQAVLYPEASEYLFFVSKGDGSHHFSKTLEEHNAAVAKYQLGR